MKTGKNRVDAVISMHFKFADEDAIEVLSALNVPVINAIQIYGRTVEEWRRSTQGLSNIGGRLGSWLCRNWRGFRRLMSLEALIIVAAVFHIWPYPNESLERLDARDNGLNCKQAQTDG